MRTFFALLLIVTLLAFIFTGAYAVDGIQTELEDGLYYTENEEKPVKINEKPVVILPEEPATFELGDENSEDNKGKDGRKAPVNTPSPKPEYHRKMMYR